MNKQKGSAHVIAIVVLVIALLGALGFIFWQNFINKPAAKTEVKQSSKSTADTTKSTPVKTNNAKFDSDELTFEYPKTSWNELHGLPDAVAEIQSDDYKHSMGMGLDSGATIYIGHTGQATVPQGFGTKDVQEITVDGHKGYKYELDYEGYRLQAFFTASGTTYLVTMETATAPTDSDKKVYDLVLSTLHIK